MQPSLARKCFRLFGSSQITVHCRLRNVSFKMTFCTLSASFAAQQKTSVNMFYVSVTLFHFPDFCMTVEICVGYQTLLCHILECKVEVHRLSLLTVPCCTSYSLHLIVLAFSAVRTTQLRVLINVFTAILVHEVSIKCHDSLHSIFTLICYIHRMMDMQISLELNA